MSTLAPRCFVLAAGLAALGFFAACGSTSATQSSDRPAKSGRPQRVLYVNYASGKKFELVNESHSDRTETYSETKPLDEAYTKITPDEVLDEVVLQLKKGGFAEKSAPGSAPESGPAEALEVENEGRIMTWTVSRTTSVDDRKKFAQCRNLMIEVYSNSYALQSVDRAPDWQRQNVQPKKKGQ